MKCFFLTTNNFTKQFNLGKCQNVFLDSKKMQICLDEGRMFMEI